MKDMQIKLNELVSPDELRAKRRGSLYTLNNSLKRNTLHSFTPIRTEDIAYDCKLPQMTLKRKDLARILELILTKEEKNLPDRNFLRRILVEIFDEELIFAGSRHFVNHLSLLRHRANDLVAGPTERLLYFILRGAAVVKSGGWTYEVSAGSTFGELELLSNESIDEITYTDHTLMVVLSQVNFDNYFRQYFEKKYEEKFAVVQSIRERYLRQVPRMNQYYFLNLIQCATFNSGEKIVEKGKPVDRIYFVGENWKGEAQSNLVDGCFGLKEVMRGKECYLESAYSLDLGYRVPFVEKEVFLRYIKDFMVSTSHLMGRSTLKPTNPVQNPEEKELAGKKMNFKRVRIQSKAKKVYTQPIDTIISEFKFFRNGELSSKASPKCCRLLNASPLEYRNRISGSVQIKASKKILF